MRKYKLPFREGHHFASEVVSYAKANDIKPLDFPYSEAPKIYAKTVREKQYPTELPMSEEEFRSTLDPVAIVKKPCNGWRSAACRNAANAQSGE